MSWLRHKYRTFGQSLYPWLFTSTNDQTSHCWNVHLSILLGSQQQRAPWGHCCVPPVAGGSNCYVTVHHLTTEEHPVRPDWPVFIQSSNTCLTCSVSHTGKMYTVHLSIESLFYPTQLRILIETLRKPLERSLLFFRDSAHHVLQQRLYNIWCTMFLVVG